MTCKCREMFQSSVNPCIMYYLMFLNSCLRQITNLATQWQCSNSNTNQPLQLRFFFFFSRKKKGGVGEQEGSESYWKVQFINSVFVLLGVVVFLLLRRMVFAWFCVKRHPWKSVFFRHEILKVLTRRKKSITVWGDGYLLDLLWWSFPWYISGHDVVHTYAVFYNDYISITWGGEKRSPTK